MKNLASNTINRIVLAAAFCGVIITIVSIIFLIKNILFQKKYKKKIRDQETKQLIMINCLGIIITVLTIGFLLIKRICLL